MYIYVYTYVHIYTFIYKYVCVSIYLYLYIFIYKYICIHIYMKRERERENQRKRAHLPLLLGFWEKQQPSIQHLQEEKMVQGLGLIDLGLRSGAWDSGLQHQPGFACGNEVETFYMKTSRQRRLENWKQSGPSRNFTWRHTLFASSQLSGPRQ